MPYDNHLAERFQSLLKGKRSVSEKKMFGGLCFLVNGNMACGVERNKLVVRVGPDAYEAALKLKHARKMDFTGKPLKGFVYVLPEGTRRADSLRRWVERGVDCARALPKK